MSRHAGLSQGAPGATSPRNPVSGAPQPGQSWGERREPGPGRSHVDAHGAARAVVARLIRDLKGTGEAGDTELAGSCSPFREFI